ncbi:hypothetical protein [Saccharothrix algeriensis]|uniref:Secreted protein n=1 Tax=Saccharothrix algeriensis TaxID=173560 RepID=A0A8T8I2Y0_9PSEU|nr:hypothetical protein [Saccharothrix algeriensis]MBM7811181.1 hypothetical protein [Saccharothrix algeriensis]QTR05099.1 hypothetical protein J7S33_10535 [Saccharothrix algeriensis]
MNHILARRAGAVAAALALTLAGAPAHAANPAGVASVGAADFTRAGQRVVVPVLARCAVEGPTSASSPAVSEPGIRFGAGTSSCTTTVLDAQQHTTRTQSVAEGSDFELSALVPAGGPRLRIGKWRITCTGDQAGTSAGWSLGGASGFAGLPDEIPVNHLHEVKDSAGAVLARITFNEVLVPEPNDGSIAMNVLRLRFTEASGATGEVVLGSVACSPTP